MHKFEDFQLEVLINDFKATRDFNSILKLIETDSFLFEKLIKVCLSDSKYPFPEYSSWILVHYAQNNNKVFLPFLEQIINRLKTSSNQTILRNLVAILKHIPLNENIEGELLDILIEFVADNQNKVALQVYSIQLLGMILKRHPDLKDELKALLNLNYQDKSPAYRIARREFLKHCE